MGRLSRTECTYLPTYLAGQQSRWLPWSPSCCFASPVLCVLARRAVRVGSSSGDVGLQWSRHHSGSTATAQLSGPLPCPRVVFLMCPVAPVQSFPVTSGRRRLMSCTQRPLSARRVRRAPPVALARWTRECWRFAAVPSWAFSVGADGQLWATFNCSSQVSFSACSSSFRSFRCVTYHGSCPRTKLTSSFSKMK